MQTQITQWVLQNKARILETNRRLVGIRSENLYPNGEELRAQHEMKAILEQIGFHTDMFTPSEVKELRRHEAFLDDGRHYEDRPNVVGTLKGAGGGRSLMFSGHMDTVPLGTEAWRYDPFAGEVAEGRQYGLGIFDMKGGMAAALMAAQCIRELGITLRGDLIIESVVDEEFGGANGTLACRLRGYQADAAIIPEPSNMVVCPANQGGLYYRVRFEGKSGRAYSGEELRNPIYAAARFIDMIREYDEWRNTRPRPPLFENQTMATLIQAFHAGDTRFDLSDRVPSACFMDVWIQCWPNVTEEALHAEFAEFCKPRLQTDELFRNMPPQLEKRMRFLPGTGIAGDHPIVETLLRTGRQVRGGGLPVHGAPFACDSFLFNLHFAVPAVILGPSGGNAHNANEFIDVDEFLELVEIYALTIVDWCGIHA